MKPTPNHVAAASRSSQRAYRPSLSNAPSKANTPSAQNGQFRGIPYAPTAGRSTFAARTNLAAFNGSMGGPRRS